MSTDRINHLNSALMVVSCVAAYLVPLQLFLFAYAILGPLHYATEISWLHDRGYFAQRRGPRMWWLVLVAGSMAALMYGYIRSEVMHQPVPAKYEIATVYLVFAAALMLHHVRERISAIALLAVTAIALVLASESRVYFVIAYFLVTIVHVLVFTAAFVLYGALKTRSRSALVSLGVFAVCAISFFVFAPVAAAPPQSLRTIYAFFEPLNRQLLALIGSADDDLFASRGGLAVMRLIAFAYTYHYLNWFSKTSIIRWHEVSRARGVAVIAVWIAAVALYLYNYTVGLSFLYFFSFLHVLLEFPLNHQTFVGIGRELAVVRRRSHMAH